MMKLIMLLGMLKEWKGQYYIGGGYLAGLHCAPLVDITLPSLHTHYTRSFTALAAPATACSIIVLCQIVNLEMFDIFLLQDLIWSNWKIGTMMFNGITNVMILTFKAFHPAY